MENERLFSADGEYLKYAKSMIRYKESRKQYREKYTHEKPAQVKPCYINVRRFYSRKPLLFVLKVLILSVAF